MPRLATFALLAAASSPLGAPEAERFRREVDEGSTLRRTFEFESTLELEELELTLGGEPHPAGPLEGIELRRAGRIVVEDDFGPPAAGRPRRLVRYFEELGEQALRAVAGPDGTTEAERSLGSELERRSVSFALGLNDEGDHVVAWEGDPGEDELLEGLVEDMDLRAFLPADEVDLGQAWEVPARAYLLLARPGGVELRAGDDEESDRRLSAELADSLAGEIEAVFRGQREVDGASVAVVELAIAVSSEASAPIPTDDEATARVALRYVHELEGELLWDTEGGHLRALELRGRLELEERTTIVLGGHEREQRARYAGTSEHTVQVERAD